jgi:hypothetical protein
VPVTEIMLSGGQHLRVEGGPHDVESTILSAARGSLMELAWMTEAESGRPVGVNPDHVQALRALDPSSDRLDSGSV